MNKEVNLGQERRKYIRLDSVLPVQFRILSSEGKNSLSEWLQGFTNNVGKGGICLTVNKCSPQILGLLKEKQGKVSLEIEMPFLARPIKAESLVSWVKDCPECPDKCLVGLNYRQIDPSQNKSILRYARLRQLFVPLLFSIIIALVAGLAMNSFINLKLTQGNKELVGQLVGIVQESSIAKQKVKLISKEKDDLQVKLQALAARIRTVEEERLKAQEEAKAEQELSSQKLDEFKALVEQLAKEKTSLEAQLSGLSVRENAVTEELLHLGQKKASLEKLNLDKMYQWLKIHQNPRTGLVMSFEGDRSIENWAFTYDQALLIQAYANFSDFARAKKLLDFFGKKAKRVQGGFANAYYANDGQPAEYIVHSGPNIWLGIAALQYAKKSNDYSYTGLAEGIAEWVMRLQKEDPDAGIRGGPDVEWFATEHNLDAYAFFDMLYKTTGKAQYRNAQEKVLNWLLKNTYAKIDPPVKRGKGDSTIATDTYAWSIAAIGPEKLEAAGMNPDKIMEFAEENCAVTVSLRRPEGQVVEMKGFDFAPVRHVARGGVISSEWTAQMVVSFKIMSDFYYKKNMPAKARYYAQKADEYLSELSNMIISSPSPSGQGESCMAYASEDFVDTGHGWLTPKGKSTGSVAGTVYTLFAYYKYNPLELK